MIIYQYPNLSAGCNIATNYGLRIRGGSMGTNGVCNNSYGLYVEVPAYGQNRFGAYISGLVGLGMTPAVQFDLSSDGARKLSTTVWWTGSDGRVKLNIVDADISRKWVP